MDITTAEYIQLNCNERHLGDANISRILDDFVFDIKILILKFLTWQIMTSPEFRNKFDILLVWNS